MDAQSEKPNAAERWEAWYEKNGIYAPDDPMDLTWGRRGDGALMLQDEWGWFSMVSNGMGDIGAQSSDPNDDPFIQTVNCNSFWLSWAERREAARDWLGSEK